MEIGAPVVDDDVDVDVSVAEPVLSCRRLRRRLEGLFAVVEEAAPDGDADDRVVTRCTISK